MQELTLQPLLGEVDSWISMQPADETVIFGALERSPQLQPRSNWSATTLVTLHRIPLEASCQRAFTSHHFTISQGCPRVVSSKNTSETRLVAVIH